MPDTALVTVASQIDSALSAHLRSLGSAGRLGTGYLLKSATATDRETVALSYDLLEFPRSGADTVLVWDREGHELPYLAAALTRRWPGSGPWLSMGSGMVWQIERRTYFRRPAGYGVAYRVVDRSRQTVQALLALDQTGDRKAQLVGTFSMDLPNVFGPLRRLRVDMRRLSPVTQSLRIAYTEPRFPGLPVGLQLDYSQDLRDTLYVRREGALEFSSRPGLGWQASAGIGWRRLHVTAHGAAQGLVAYEQRQLRLSVARDNLDRPDNPRQGYQVTLTASGGNLTGDGHDENDALLMGTFTLLWLKQVGGWVWAQEWRASLAAGLGYTPQLADFTSFGGGASVRGYREDHLLAPGGLTLRSEFRRPLGDSGRLYLFGDVARTTTGALLAGTGFGILLPAGATHMQIDIAWNREDSFRNPKLHLRLLNLLAGGRSDG